MKLWLTAASLVLAIAAVIYLLIVPSYTGFDGSHPTHATLLQVNGQRAIIPMMFPVVVALAALILRTRKASIIAAILMCSFAFLGGFTIGFLYLPAAVLLLIALDTEWKVAPLVGSRPGLVSGSH